METIALYLLVGLILEFVFYHLGKWPSPDPTPPILIEKVFIIILWPLLLVLFIYHFIIEYFKLRK